MFTGHFSAALIGAGRARRLPLGLLIVAAFGADIQEGLVALFNYRDTTRVWSHSIPATAAIGAVLALAWMIRGGASASWRDAAVIFLVAISHTALDFVTAVKSVWPGAHAVGFGLYSHPVPESLLEIAFCVIGWLVWRASLPPSRKRTRFAWGMLAVLVMAQASLLLGTQTLDLKVQEDALSKFVR
ncbi:MAG TPA: hypothetical protein VE967_06615 [Gemmatimonadaceae bacterium]|nr:hypothetical protein [Gemmatimonadaceae bacterium]